MKTWEVILSLVVFAGALYYLYRKIVVTRGCSCGNSGCRSAESSSPPFPIADNRGVDKKSEDNSE